MSNYYYCNFIDRLLIESTIFDSVLISKELVASSNIKHFGFLYKALANAILCICPPLNLTPLSPTWVSNPFDKDLIND